MASFWTITRNLTGEMTREIHALTPNSNRDVPFLVRPVEETEARPFAEAVRTNRMFEFGLPTIDAAGGGVELFLGTKNRSPRVLFPLRVAYQEGYVHAAAISDDADLLTAWMLNNTSKVSGVQVRSIDAPPTLEQRPEDKWIVAEYVVIAVLTITDP